MGEERVKAEKAKMSMSNSKTDTEEPNKVVSQIHTNVVVVAWKLENFRTMHHIHSGVQGPSVEIKAASDGPVLTYCFFMELISRQLVIICKIMDYGDETNVPVRKQLYGKFEVEILNADGAVWKRQSTAHIDWRRRISYAEKLCRLGDMLNGNIFDESGTLELRITVKTFHSRSRPFPSPEVALRKVSKSVREYLPTDLKALESDETAKDIRFKTMDGVVLKAHKILLTARSPVFKAMFETDMQEGLSGFVDVGDISSKSMSVLFHYMYTGQLHEDWKDVPDEVIYGAEKYGLEGLLEYCDKMLGTICNQDNTENLLKVAQLYSLKTAESEINKLMNNEWP
ncbi:unnamed protein product [Orchesella dallaii]|uniref:BTB domain-containing protein n=1 Tax=Orchesella dallaii TaxID=48710 RepID=A0ABP1QWJ9_9HEXA